MMTQTTTRKTFRAAVPLGIFLVLIAAVVMALVLSQRDEPAGGDADSTSASSDAGGSSSASDGKALDGGGAAGGATGVPPQPTSVEAPQPGKTEPVEKPPATSEAAFDEEVTVADSLHVEVVSVEAVEAGRDIPGEKAGPAVKVVISVQNSGDAPVDTAGVSVNLTYDGDNFTPAPEVLDDTSSVLAATIPPGGSGQGTYLFSVPLDSDGNVRIMVDVLASEPDVVFAGPRP